jgi:hypothetical protein
MAKAATAVDGMRSTSRSPRAVSHIHGVMQIVAPRCHEHGMGILRVLTEGGCTARIAAPQIFFKPQRNKDDP